MIERDKYALKARLTGYTLNAAIGIQVLLGSLTTAISAAISGKSVNQNYCFLSSVIDAVHPTPGSDRDSYTW
jgi:hypothetical protein